MRSPVSWLSLAVCVGGLKAEQGCDPLTLVPDTPHSSSRVRVSCEPTNEPCCIRDKVRFMDCTELITHLHPPVLEFVNSTCVFPFMYGDSMYYNCISLHSDYDWCSLDKKFQGRWRYCTGQDPPKCAFPFLYRKKLFYGCTKNGYVLNRSWCSLTKNYNRDGKWKQCSPYGL